MLDITPPAATGYTIYTKAGCYYCTKAKEYLKEHATPFAVIDCDEYLFEDRDGFLAYMHQCAATAGTVPKSFPMIFHNAAFVGGFEDLKTYFAADAAFSGTGVF